MSSNSEEFEPKSVLNLNRPPEDFELVSESLKMLKGLDEFQDFLRGAIRGASGPGEPIADMFFQRRIADEESSDRVYVAKTSNPDAVEYYIKEAKAARVKARDHIHEDINLFNSSFPGLNLSEQQSYVELLKKRQEYLHANQLDKYQGEYAETEKKFTAKITKNMIENINRLNVQSAGSEKSLAVLRILADRILQDTNNNNIDIRELRDKLSDFVEKSRVHGAAVLRKLMNNNKNIQLTSAQIALIEKRLVEFNYKYDQDRAQNDKQYQVTHLMLSKILQAEEKKNRELLKKQIAENSERAFMGVNSAFRAIQQLGGITKNESLAKVGELGQIGVSIVKNIGLLTGSFGFAAVGGLAMLGPISAIAMGGMALMSLFGRKGPSEIEMLSRQLREFRRSMEKYLGRVLDNQQIIYKEVADLFRFVAHDLKIPIDYKLNSILEVMDKQGKEKWLRDYDAGLQLLHENIEAVKSIINWANSCEGNVFGEEKAYDLEGKLAAWIEHGASRPTFVGSFQHVDSSEKALVDIATKINYQSIHLLTLPLTILASHVDSKFPRDIVLGELVNINIFSMALASYNRLIAFKTKLEKYNYDLLANANKLLSNFHRFVEYLSRESVVYDYLIKTYHQHFVEVHALLDMQFQREKNLLVERKSKDFIIKGNLGNIVAKNTEIGLRLRQSLEIMDACRTLICAYSTFSGNSPEQYLQAVQYSSVDILNKEVDWSSLHNTELNWSGTKVSHNDVSGWAIRSITAKCEDSEAVMLVSMHRSFIVVKQYNPKNNSWLDKSDLKIQDLQHPSQKISCVLFLVGKVTRNDQDYLYLVYDYNSRLKMSCFDVKNNQWYGEGEAPIFECNKAQNTIYTSTLRLVTLPNKGQDTLFFVGCYGGSVQIQSYDFESNKWGHLASGPAWPEPQSFSVCGHYQSFEALPIRNTAGEYQIMMMLRTNGGVQLVSFDPRHRLFSDYPLNKEMTDLRKMPRKHAKSIFLAGVRLSAQPTGQNNILIFNTKPKEELPCFYPIRYTVIPYNNFDYLVAVMRKAKGLDVMALNPEQNKWEKWHDPSTKKTVSPNWSDTAGLGQVQYSQSMRLTTVCLAGHYYLLCGLRNKESYECYLFDPTTKEWSPLLEKPQWSDALFGVYPKFNSSSMKNASINVLPVTTSQDHQQLVMLARTRYGLDYWQCQLRVPQNVMQSNVLALKKFGTFKQTGSEQPMLVEAKSEESSVEVGMILRVKKII